MNLSKEAKVGLLAIVALTMLYFGFNFLKGSDIFSSSKKYVILYDNIDGLTVSNPVLLNGLSVGRVERIDIIQEKNNQLLVTVDVDKKIRVGRGSKAVLADGGLLGGKVIILQIQQRGPELTKGDTLIGLKEAGITALIREKTLPVLNNVDSLTHNLNTIVRQFDQTGVVLNRTLKSAEVATGTLELAVSENRANLREVLGNVSRLSASLIQTEKELKPILGKANTFADSLNALQLRQTLDNANRTVATLQRMLADINSGQGTLGKLKSDEALYRSINSTTQSLDLLLTDLRENPKRYVHFSLFGRKEKKKDQPATPAATTPAASSTAAVKSDSVQ